MDLTLKQRLIGAAVLIAAGVIFIPMLLDGPGQHEHASMDMEIPPEPQYTFEQQGTTADQTPAAPPDTQAQQPPPSMDRSTAKRGSTGTGTQGKQTAALAEPEQSTAEQPAPGSIEPDPGSQDPAEQQPAAGTATDSQPAPKASDAAGPAAEANRDAADAGAQDTGIQPGKHANPPADNQPDTLPASEGWVVQVGSFSKQHNAVALRDKLRAAGFSVFNDHQSGSSLFRVKVGPEPERKQAEQLQARLQNDADLKGIVLSYP